MFCCIRGKDRRMFNINKQVSPNINPKLHILLQIADQLGVTF